MYVARAGLIQVRGWCAVCSWRVLLVLWETRQRRRSQREGGGRRGGCCCMPLHDCIATIWKTISLSCSVFLLQQLRTTTTAARLSAPVASAACRHACWTSNTGVQRSEAPSSEEYRVDGDVSCVCVCMCVCVCDCVEISGWCLVLVKSVKQYIFPPQVYLRTYTNTGKGTCTRMPTDTRANKADACAHPPSHTHTHTHTHKSEGPSTASGQCPASRSRSWLVVTCGDLATFPRCRAPWRRGS